MLTETRQISNLRNQDGSEEILSDLVRKDVAESLEMFKAALNNFSMLKIKFF